MAVSASGRLKWDTLAYVIALAVDRFSGFLLLPILTGAWNQESFAAWSQILVAYAFISNVLLVGFYHSIVRYIPGMERDRVAKIFHGMLAIILANCALFLVVVTISSRYLSLALFASSEFESLVLPGALFIASECIFEFVLLGFMRADGRIVVGSNYYTGKNVARLVLLGFFAAQGIVFSLAALVIVNLGITVIVYVLHIAPSFQSSSKSLEPGFWPDLVRYSLPIVASSTFLWANTSLNRFFIVHFLGLADLSIYAVNYSIASMVHVTAMVVSFILVPRVNAAWNMGDKAQTCRLLKMATEYYLFGAVPIGLAVSLFYPQILMLLASETYGSSLLVVTTLVGFMILLGVEQILMFATLVKNSYFSLGVRTLALGINVLLNLLFIKNMGLLGSVLAGNAALGITILLSIWHLKNEVPGYVFPWRETGELLLAGMAMLGMGIILMAWLPSARPPALIASGMACGVVYLGAESFRASSVFRALVGGLFQKTGAVAREHS